MYKVSPSDRMKMILDQNLDVLKEIKTIRYSKYVNKYKRFPPYFKND